MIKVALLAGGLGTRFAEETDSRPKPMISIGEYPMLWHIMKYYSAFGAEDFYIATGYKGEMIRSYFAHYSILEGSIMVDLATGKIENYTLPPETWRVHLIETGQESHTGGRLLRMKDWLAGPDPFMLTYGDGLSNVDIDALLQFHRSHGKLATLTAVRPPSRFGEMIMDGDQIVDFSEKPVRGEGWINGGFFVLEKEVFNYLSADSDSFEFDTLERLAREGQLMAFKHGGFWQCMDSLRDKRFLESLWHEGKAPWKIWKE